MNADATTSVLTHPFDAAVALTPEGEHRFSGRTSAAYANFVGPFGGITAAAMLNAALLHPERLGNPLSLTVNFAAPIANGEFTILARPARTNRSTQHWIIELSQADGICATATAVFAARRDTWSAPEARPPQAPAAELVPPMPSGFLPPWARNYEIRVAAGLLTPGAGEQPDSQSVQWVRDEPPRPLDFASLAALSDIFFPRIFLRRQKLLPIGTVSLTTFFHADAALLAQQGTTPLLGTARAQRFRNGYFDQSAELWGLNNELLVSTHQVVYFKD